MALHAPSFSEAQHTTLVQTFDTFSSCLGEIPLCKREKSLGVLREYLERVLSPPWPASVSDDVVTPDDWRPIAEILRNDVNRECRHDEIGCFVSQALFDVEELTVLSTVSLLTTNALASPLFDERGGSSPGSPITNKRRRSRADDVASDTTDAPDESIERKQRNVEDIFKELLENNAEKAPTEADLMFILELAVSAFEVERNIVLVPVPAVVVGDVHGQLKDLKERILANGGPFGTTTYLFLGDYVDRGDASLHCIALLAAAKILYPNQVFLLRGNHESRNTNGCYGFLSECHAKYPQGEEGDSERARSPPPGIFAFGMGAHPLWNLANRLFDQLPIAAIVGEKMFCVHGGLSPRAQHLAQIVACRRATDITAGSVLADLTWSDPFDQGGFVPNNRGCGQLFGPDMTKQFLEINGLTLLCRAHQCVRSGYLWSHDDQVVTVFSAPNYCGQGNDGAIMLVDKDGVPSFVCFRSALSWDDNELEEEDDSGMAGSPVVQQVAPPPKSIPTIFSVSPTAVLPQQTQGDATDGNAETTQPATSADDDARPLPHVSS